MEEDLYLPLIFLINYNLFYCYKYNNKIKFMESTFWNNNRWIKWFILIEYFYKIIFMGLKFWNNNRWIKWIMSGIHNNGSS